MMKSDDIQLLTDARLAEIVEERALFFDCMARRFGSCGESDAEMAAILHEAARRLKAERHYPDNYNFD